MQEPITINIGNVADGAMMEAFDKALREVLANIADLSTPATQKRSIAHPAGTLPHLPRDYAGYYRVHGAYEG